MTAGIPEQAIAECFEDDTSAIELWRGRRGQSG
jgi:hypothetical protein